MPLWYLSQVGINKYVDDVTSRAFYRHGTKKLQEDAPNSLLDEGVLKLASNSS